MIYRIEAGPQKAFGLIMSNETNGDIASQKEPPGRGIDGGAQDSKTYDKSSRN